MNWFSGFWVWMKGWFVSPDERIKTVQEATVNVCRFLPTASTVLNLLSLSNPAMLTAEAIAYAICRALRKQPAALFGSGKPKPMIEGVVIEGDFVVQ